MIQRLRFPPFSRTILCALIVVVTGAFSRNVARADKTWNGSASFSWNEPANWTTGGLPTASDLAIFGTTNAGTLTLDANQSVLGLSFSSTSATPYIINNGGAFSLSLGASGITTSSTTLTTINADIGLTANQTWTVGSGGLTVGGIISGGFALTTTGNGTLTLTGANTYLGATNITAGTFTLSGANGAISSSAINVLGGKLVLDNSTIVNSSRIGSTATVTVGFNGEVLLSDNVTGVSVTQNFGTLALSGGSGTLTVTPAVAGQVQTLAASSLTRSSGATLLVRGQSLGAAASTNITRVTIADLTGVTQIGTNTASGGPGTTKDLKIIPYVFADTSGTGIGSGIATYDTTKGLRPLVANEATLLSASYTTVSPAENVRANTTTQLVNSIVVNSLSLSNIALTGTSTTITVNSGVIFGSGNGSIGSTANPITGITLDSGEGIIYVATTGTSINAPINVTGTGTGGLVKAGPGGGTLTANNSPYSGPTTLNGGTLTVNTLANGGAASSLGSSAATAGNLVFNGGTLELATLSTIALINSTDRLFTIGPNNATIFSSGGSASTTTFSNTGAIAFSGSAARTLTLSSGRGSLTFNPSIGDGGGPTTMIAGSGAASGFSANLVFANVNNTYTGPTILSIPAAGTGTLTAALVANGGQPSSIGQSSSAASNLMFSPARIFAVQSGSTDRLFTLNGTANGDTFTINATAGTSFTSTGSVLYGTVNQTRTLQLQGGTVANPNTFAPLLTDNGTGALSLTIGNGTITNWSLTGANTYTGVTTISSSTTAVPATLIVTSLANGGVASSIGAATNAASNLVLVSNGNAADLPTLKYTGTGSSTDRLFTFSTTKTSNPIAIDASGTGALNFTNAGAIAFAGAANAVLTLNLIGTSTSDNTFALKISNNGTGLTALTKLGAGIWRITSSTSDYTGVTTIGPTSTTSGGVLAVDVLANGGSPSGLGAASSLASNILINIGTLRYTGTGGSTDRQVTFVVSGSSTLEASGTGPINFTATGNQAYGGSTNQPRIVTLGGTNTGANTIATNFVPNGTGTVSIVKNDAGTWVLTGTNTYTGTTTINTGTLYLNGANSGIGAISVTGTLGGTGSTAATITVNSGGVIRGGTGSGGTASTSTLTLGGAAVGLTIASGGALGVFITDGTVPSTGTAGSSTIGGVPTPTSNTFLQKTSTGGVTFNSAGIVQVNLNWGSFTPNVPYSYQVGSGFGSPATTFYNADANFQYFGGAAVPGSSSLTRDVSGNLYLNFTPTPVPEPTTTLLAAAGLLAGVRICRRGRRSDRVIVA